jgi:hypothetical protein
LPNNVIGSEMEIGSAVSGANGFDGAVGAAAGVLLTLAVGMVTFGVVDAAPAGPNPTKRAAARTTPLPMAPSEVRRFRLKVLLLFVD